MKLDPKHAPVMAYADQRFALIRDSSDKLVAKCRAELDRLEDPTQVWMLMRTQMLCELGIDDQDSMVAVSVELLVDLILRRAQEENEKGR